MATKSTKPTRATKSTRAAKPVTRSTRSQPVVRNTPTKPVVQTGTWVTILLLAIAVGAAFYINRQAETTAEETLTLTPEATEQAFVFDSGSVLNAIKVKPAEGATVELKRNAENAWALILPEKTEADQGLAEAAASQVSALGIITEVSGATNLSDFGLEAPAYIINLGFEGGTSNVLKVGDLTPSQNGYYVQLDDETVYVVGRDGIDALISLTFAPPYLNTPTPSPTATLTALPSETPAPGTETTSTPEASPTP